jgi:hypothetical protein
MRKLCDLVKSFDEDLSRGAVDVDGYYREARDVAGGTPLASIVGTLNEAMRQRLGLPLGGELDALHPVFLAGALFMAACESEEPDRAVAVLFGYSYASLAGGKPLDAIIFLLASTAAARGRGDVAAELLKKIGIDLESIVSFACGAVGLAKLLESRGACSIPDW